MATAEVAKPADLGEGAAVAPGLDGDSAPDTVQLGFKQMGIKGKAHHVLEHAGLRELKSDPSCLHTSEWMYFKHVGFNNTEISRGAAGKGEVEYIIDVKAKLVGWDVTIRRAGGEALMHLRKDVTFMRLLGWDKGTEVHVSDLSEEGAVSPSKTTLSEHCKVAAGKVRSRPLAGRRDSVSLEEPLAPATLTQPLAPGDVIVPEVSDEAIAAMDDASVAELPAEKVTSITRNHAMRSNENTFEFGGRTYAWIYWIALGSKLTLTDAETKEVLAVVHLRPTWRLQMLTNWSWRCNGTLELKQEVAARGLRDVAIATLAAMLQWRKHNNKYWIIAAAIA